MEASRGSSCALSCYVCVSLCVCCLEWLLLDCRYVDLKQRRQRWLQVAQERSDHWQLDVRASTPMVTRVVSCYSACYLTDICN